MSRKMLIDASHSEETRVAIVEGNRVEEFDFESASKKPIRGNIYLAKVTRVEPSLQAAFVEYGGNRHGFLAFNEIHPDYYQIPHEDRLELQAEEEKAVEQALAEADDSDGDENAENGESGEDDTDAEVEAVARKRRQFFRKYKIQEVIKRRQILLVQVAKEERGNKGAALTTYLSLAGRYCVLMPNTPRGGGISRKIANGKDRKRLKEIVSDLDLPTGMGLIVRTAGATRTKAEIRRDHDYLRRVWEDIRSKTLESVAPSLVYEEGDLVRRAIRDMYDRDVEIVMVEGETGYKDAKTFMKLLMPSHASKVQQYKEPMPLFVRHHVEDQLEAAYNAETPLKSGGYLVIHQTEALVAIDVNSGRSTRERNIEDTALKTNLEAADEAARQMRLRDLAGLLVIDFIDMEENRNIRAVEKRMKDALKKDRARLQMGRISQFGLMEISRQRRRTSILEGSTKTCPHCGGKGYVRTAQSSSLVALRALEEEGARKRATKVRINLPTDVALYLLNEKRDHVLSLEQRYDFRVLISADPDLIPPDFRVEVLETRKDADGNDVKATAPATPTPTEDKPAASDEGSGSGRRRRRRRRKKDDEADLSAETEAQDEADDNEGETQSASDDEESAPRKRRRRGRRGGRGRRRNRSSETAETSAENDGETPDTPSGHAEAAEESAPDALKVIDPADMAQDLPVADTEPVKPKRRTRRKKADSAEEAPAEAAAAADEPPAEEAAADEKPKRKRAPRKKAASTETDAPADTADAPSEDKPKRKRAPRKKADSAEAAEPAEAADAPAEEKPKRKRAAPKKAEDSADKAADDAASEAATEAEADDKPKRTGWWQRGSKLFGK